MRIVLCASLDFSLEIQETSQELSALGHTVTIPETAAMILSGDVTLKQILHEKQSGRLAARTIKQDSLRKAYNHIRGSDAIFVLNLDKNGVHNYIGGNVLVEMAFAWILNKPIFLLNDVPEVAYSDLIRAMNPILLHGNIAEIT